MNAEVITIGDELLIGQVIDTNSAWIGRELNTFGIKLNQILSISDKREVILNALAASQKTADLVLITGGLGPTNDDITKEVLCEYFGCNLEMNEQVLAKISAYFDERGKRMADVNRFQAMLPDDATVLNNPIGTAQGMWFEKDGTVFVSMPGVPYEMKRLMQHEVLPRVIDRFKTESIVHRTVMTIGVGESSIMEIIASWEKKLAADQVKLAYLPSAGKVRLRLSIVTENETHALKTLQKHVDALQPLIGEIIYGYDDEKLEEIVGKQLNTAGKTLGLAESCTGGFISHRITSISGSSSYYEGSLVTYSYDVKSQQIGVSKDDLLKYGAVSGTVVEQMAAGVCKQMGVDYAIAVSGIAGPGGGTPDKPVGTVWIAVAGPNGIRAHQFLFGKDRMRNIEMTANASLNMLRLQLIEDNQ